MKNKRPILASRAGADHLKRQLAQRDTKPGSDVNTAKPDLLLQPTLMELLQLPADGDNYDEQTIQQVRRDGDGMEEVREKTVRLLGGRAVALHVNGTLTLVSASIHIDVQLTEDLVAATAFDSAPGIATANVLVRNPTSGNLEKLVYDGATVTVEIVNRNEHWDTVPAFTFGGGIIKNDEWRPDDFDCDAAAGGLI